MERAIANDCGCSGCEAQALPNGLLCDMAATGASTPWCVGFGPGVGGEMYLVRCDENGHTLHEAEGQQTCQRSWSGGSDSPWTTSLASDSSTVFAACTPVFAVVFLRMARFAAP